MDVCHISFIVFYHSFFYWVGDRTFMPPQPIPRCVRMRRSVSLASRMDYICRQRRAQQTKKKEEKSSFSQLQPIEYCP